MHKVDSFSEDQCIECQREIRSHLSDELTAARLGHVKVNFHLTSIYDHSVFEAFSKVVQQLIPQLPTLERLLDTLVSSCRIEKAFLFDVVSKIYIATDSSPVDMQSYELCADMIDVVIDVSCIYGSRGGTPPLESPTDAPHANPPSSPLPVVAPPSAAESNCVITLSDGNVLFLREVDRSLALVCLLKDSVLRQQGLLEYNCTCFRDALAKLFALPAVE